MCQCFNVVYVETSTYRRRHFLHALNQTRNFSLVNWETGLLCLGFNSCSFSNDRSRDCSRPTRPGVNDNRAVRCRIIRWSNRTDRYISNGSKWSFGEIILVSSNATFLTGSLFATELISDRYFSFQGVALLAVVVPCWNPWEFLVGIYFLNHHHEILRVSCRYILSQSSSWNLESFL